MIVMLLTEHHLEFLSLKRGCRRSSGSTLVKMPYCWKSHSTARVSYMSAAASIKFIKKSRTYTILVLFQDFVETHFFQNSCFELIQS